MRTYYYMVNGCKTTTNVPETPDDMREFRVWFEGASRRGCIALDTETTGLNIYSAGFALRAIQFGDADTAWVIHWERGGIFHEAGEWALAQGAQFLIHNAAFDWLVLDRCTPVTMESLSTRTWDTKIMAGLIDPRAPQEGAVGTSLKGLSAHYVDPAAPDTQQDLTRAFHANGFTLETGWAGISIDHPTYNLYAGLDVIFTARLYPVMRAKLVELGVRQELVKYEHELAQICATMQRRGMVLDIPYVSELESRLRTEEAEHVATAAKYGVTSINSSRQISEALVGMGETLTEQTAGGATKVDKSVLLALADMDARWERIGARPQNPLADAVLRGKRAGKWCSTYVDTFLSTVDADGRVHPMINSMQARTGRMTITRPALQTLPSSEWVIRRALLADPGEVVVAVDFQAVEMRVLAALGGVTRMQQAIRDGEDLHGYTARLVFGPEYTPYHRKLCKGIGFGKVYGGGAQTISRQTGAPIEDVQRAITAYERVYPEITRASNKWQRESRNAGMVFTTITGRRQPLDRDRMYAVVNYACQSTARDVLGQSLINMRDTGLLDYLRLPIHDEVVCSVPAGDAEELAREIQTCMTFDLAGVPIEASYEVGGRSWGSLYGADA